MRRTDVEKLPTSEVVTGSLLGLYHRDWDTDTQSTIRVLTEHLSTLADAGKALVWAVFAA